ncbi:hypothetical protein P7C71_g5482, partial [Lecanoromycetidae sp. Uapishka_2]
MPASLPFSKSFDFASGKIGERFQNPFWKIIEPILGGPMRRAVSDVKAFGDRIVSAAVEKRNKDEESTNESIDPLQTNLINALLDNINDHGVVADAAMNYLSAGRDTTAQSLTWAFYLLMRHQNARQNVIAEIHDTFTNNNDKQPLSFEFIQSNSLPYTAAVFNESLRLYPPVPVELKECTASTTFPDGTWLPKGAVVLWTTWALGRSKNIWGEDADQFRPERWLTDGKDGKPQTLKVMNAFEWPVFNGGPRSCLGKRMAELLAGYVIADLVTKFDFKEIIESQGIVEGMPKERQSHNSLTLPMEGGLPCYVRRNSK